MAPAVPSLLSALERIAFAEYLADPFFRLRDALSVAMPANHHRTICIKLERIDDLSFSLVIKMPQGPDNG